MSGLNTTPKQTQTQTTQQTQQTQKKFEPDATARVKELWGLKAQFGEERNVTDFYLKELVSDRYVLVKGLQLIRDELQLARAANNDLVTRSLFPSILVV